MKLRELKEVLHSVSKIVLYDENNNDEKLFNDVDDIPSYLDHYNVIDVYISCDYENHLAINIY